MAVKKKIEKRKRFMTIAAAPRGGWAFVHEPDHPSCKPTAKWRVRYRRVELTGHFDIEIRFRTRSGTRDAIIVPARDRSDFDKIRRALCAQDARLPGDRKGSLEFVETLIRATPKRAVTVVSKPGFRDGAKGFVMPMRKYGTAKSRFVWDANFADPAFGQIKGDLAQYREGILKPILASPFLSFSVLVALGAPLASYVEQRDGKGKLVPESAIFHWAGESSSGKTTLSRLAQSCFGKPDITTDYDATPRGVIEAAYTRNDLVLVLDDTESAALPDRDLLTKMRLFGQRVPAGRSKAIAKAAGLGAFPDLNWFCFGMSTGPETQAVLATRTSSKRFGERVRFIDITVPPNAEGGILGLPLALEKVAAADRGHFIAQIENAISENHGVLFDAWIRMLLRTNYSARVRSLVDEFVRLVAGGEGGLDERFARKFAPMFAAGVIALEGGLLPWPEDWPLRAVRFCWENARNNRDPDAGIVDAGLKAIADATRAKSRLARHDLDARKSPQFPDCAVGLKVRRDGASYWLVCIELLGRIGITDPRIQQLVLAKAKACGFVKASGNTTGSVQRRVRTGQGEVEKLRFWRLNRRALASWAEKRSTEASE